MKPVRSLPPGPVLLKSNRSQRLHEICRPSKPAAERPPPSAESGSPDAEPESTPEATPVAMSAER